MKVNGKNNKNTINSSRENSALVNLAPLKAGDKRYVDLSKARYSQELSELRVQIRDANAHQNRFAKIALVGHRGSGKTTELFRIQNDLSDQFVPLYLSLSNYVLRDCSYIDILLWLIEKVVRQFSAAKWPINAKVVIDITDWLAVKCFDDLEVIKEEIRSEVGTDFQSEFGIYWMPVLLLSRIKSMMVASSMHRLNIRKKLQTYTEEIIYHVNRFLDEARQTLMRINKPPDLLIIIDNFDHIPAEMAKKLFFDSAEILHSLRSHIVFTAPVALRLPPDPIGNHFEHCYYLPLVETQQDGEDDFEPGIKGLTEIVKNRLEIEKYFKNKNLALQLIKCSGGNLRDLMMLINSAQVAARASNKRQIDESSCDVSVKKISLYYEKMLIPKDVYYPQLFNIYMKKREAFLMDANRTSSGVIDARFFSNDLLSSGAVIDRTENHSKYEVHPAAINIPSFQEFIETKKKTPEKMT